MLNTLKTTTMLASNNCNTIVATSLPTRVQAAGGSWLNLQHVAPHKSGPIISISNSTTTTTTTKTTTTTTTIVIRNMGIYDYFRKHLASSKRQRSTFEPHPSPKAYPAPKLRKHNVSNYQTEWDKEDRQKDNNNNNYNNNNNNHRTKGKPSLDDYDIRFFFYLNSLILFTMSCSRQSAAEGDDLKHFICDRIRKFDRLRRKARKRRKRRPKKLVEDQMHHS